MPLLFDCRVQFYQWSANYQDRILKSFKVQNEKDAIAALDRFKVPAGWYVEIRKDDGTINKNKYIKAKKTIHVPKQNDFIKKVQFYANSKETGERKLFSFKVQNELEAKQALQRFNVKAGYYVEINEPTGEVVTNKKILK